MKSKKIAYVSSVRENLVTVELPEGALVKNEVGYIILENERLKAEVLRVRGRQADMQVFESTHGVRIGLPVELTGEMLSVVLGPGLLGQIFDGLQNPLPELAQDHGFFLPRGQDLYPLNDRKTWIFTPTVSIGDRVYSGEALGSVQEGPITHKILVPFDEPDALEVTWIRQGNFTVKTPIARVMTSKGKELEVTMTQTWPVRRPIPESMYKRGLAKRLYPTEPLVTTIRIVDTFFPIAMGGTACIPGPFGAGKTVLQSLIARYAKVDVVVIVACGERAGEVVETIQTFPHLKDPKTGGSLMDRTIIICNTSSMPVAARESSLYTGITLAEYYRQMGFQVLLIADSTSRWAQAMRETSGRMEEIPGEEAFPAYLDSAIKNIYERAGTLQCPDKSIGSLSMIGTVSPAGGNFEEPVTQSTLATVKTFLGLSSERAYRRAYPAIDPVISWTRYTDQLRDWFQTNLHTHWLDDVKSLMDLFEKGEKVYQMMQVTGEEGVTMEDYILWEKATLLDMVYFQQDAFDEVDVSTSGERQQKSLSLIKSLTDRDYEFPDKNQVREFFTRVTSLYKNFNYCAFESLEYDKLEKTILELADSFTKT